MDINACHYCGSEAYTVIGSESCWANCTGCDADGPSKPTEQEAIAEWNKVGDRIKELTLEVARLRNRIGYAI